MKAKENIVPVMELDLCTVERKIRSVSLPIKAKLPYPDVAVANEVMPALCGIGISDIETDEILQNIISLLTILDCDTNIELNLRIFYDEIYGDYRIEVFYDDSLLPIAIYQSVTEKLRLEKISRTEVGYTIAKRNEYRFDNLGLFQYEKVFGTLSDEVENAISILSEAMDMTPEEILQRLEAKLGYKIRVSANLRIIDAPVIIKINGKESVFESGQKSTNVLKAIIKYSNRFKTGANIDDVFEDIFEKEVMTERNQAIASAMKKDASRKGGKFYDHGKRDDNVDVLYDRIRHINDKIKKDTGISKDFIIKRGGKYRINPILKNQKCK